MSYSCLLLDVDNTLIRTHALELALRGREAEGPAAGCGRQWLRVPGWRRHVHLWDDEMPPVLAALAARGVRLGIVSDAPRPYVAAVLAAVGVGRYFGGCMVTAEGAAPRKPEAAPLRRALSALRHPPEGALYVGDAVEDTVASRRAGVHFGLAGWAWQTSAWEGEPPGLILGQFRDLLDLCAP